MASVCVHACCCGCPVLFGHFMLALRVMCLLTPDMRSGVVCDSVGGLYCVYGRVDSGVYYSVVIRSGLLLVCGWVVFSVARCGGVCCSYMCSAYDYQYGPVCGL